MQKVIQFREGFQEMGRGAVPKTVAKSSKINVCHDRQISHEFCTQNSHTIQRGNNLETDSNGSKSDVCQDTQISREIRTQNSHTIQRGKTLEDLSNLTPVKRKLRQNNNTSSLVNIFETKTSTNPHRNAISESPAKRRRCGRGVSEHARNYLD